MGGGGHARPVVMSNPTPHYIGLCARSPSQCAREWLPRVRALSVLVCVSVGKVQHKHETPWRSGHRTIAPRGRATACEIPGTFAQLYRGSMFVLCSFGWLVDC